ncbi:hypothetical protein JOY44_11010 [Phormidium sp. CLA17]|nr:hypothetical protein [Leptolyngbya sp. Cla-17]MBM0742145.1 hypothetical protein [Leptolyngbya sp. Cla-17]
MIYAGGLLLSVATQYSLRTWIEYGFKQVKHQLGWHDYRLTDYNSIERWGEIVFSAYLLVSIHADAFRQKLQSHTNKTPQATATPVPFTQHPHWELGTTWKSALNNLRPYWCWGWLEVWLQVFPMPGLKRALHQLMDWMNTFRIALIPLPQAA